MPEHHLRQLKELTMSPTEREALRRRLHAFAIAHPAQAAVPARVWQWAFRHGVLALGLALLVVVSATGVTAEASRPGDFLYGFRLTVNDRVETALAFSDDAQIDVEMEQLQRMIDDEEAVRDDEIDELTFVGDGELDADLEDEFEAELRAIERELELESESAIESDDAGVRRVSPTTESFDDEEEFEPELRSIELELQEEERVRLELD